ncbi:MAG: hypothetical protein ABFR62_02250 [Bacteroidota bacterium]
MKRVIIALLSFITILIIGIFIANHVINSKVDSGIHKIELEEKNSKVIEVSFDKEKDSIKINTRNSSISNFEREYIRSVYDLLKSNIDIEKGSFLFKLSN